MAGWNKIKFLIAGLVIILFAVVLAILRRSVSTLAVGGLGVCFIALAFLLPKDDSSQK
ncbi:MAG: hypothetical protein IJC83_00525 [Oscillospiraceae bacterium]|nr:hypothetical protein [Oscillospiraceae bacterium]